MKLLIFFGIIFLLPFIFLKKKDNDDVLDKDTSLFIKGILCLFVMLHNLGLDYLHTNFDKTTFKGFLWITESITESTGGVAVGVFFFLSAFGLIISYKKNGNSFLKKLLFKNTIKLYLVAVGINLLEYFTFFRNSFEKKDAILRILNLDLFNNFNRINRHGWFIATLLALYLLFILIFFIISKTKIKRKVEVSSFIIIGIALLCKLLSMIFDNGGMYTRELPCFAIGIFYGLYKDKINIILKRFYYPILVICLLGYAIGLMHYEPVAAWSICVMIPTFLTKHAFKSNIISLLGKSCLGVYLFLHFSTLVLAPYFINNVWYWILINAGFIFVLTIILEFILYIISKSFEKIKF